MLTTIHLRHQTICLANGVLLARLRRLINRFFAAVIARTSVTPRASPAPARRPPAPGSRDDPSEIGEQLEELAQTARANAAAPLALTAGAAYCQYVGRSAEAIRVSREALRLRADFIRAYRVLTASLGMAGGADAANAALESARRPHAQHVARLGWQRLPSCTRRTGRIALEGVRRAGLGRGSRAERKRPAAPALEMIS